MRALLSVYDKTGIVELARELRGLGWDLISSGGTATGAARRRPRRHRRRRPHRHPGDPRPPGGHAAPEGARRDPRRPAQPRPPEDMAEHGIEPIDLVVSNLYPFGASLDSFEHGASRAEELIDIGGPAMIRAAAKNFRDVGILTHPSQYQQVVDELKAGGVLSDATKRQLARTAFAHTAAYDAAIVGWFDEVAGDPLPPTIHLALERVQDLRYGENPHQTGARYREVGTTSWWDDVEQHGGMALSYLNLFDADAAWGLANDLAADLRPAGRRHHQARQPVRRGGGRHARRRLPAGLRVRRALGLRRHRRPVAPGRRRHRRAHGRRRPGRRRHRARLRRRRDRGADQEAQEHPAAHRRAARRPTPHQIRQLTGSWLVQDAHHFASTRADWRVVTKREPTEAEWADAELAWRLVGWVKSNSIVLVKDGTAWGIGAGQQNRVEAGQIAASKAAGRAKGGACASDAFYPFPDGIEAAADAGVAVVIQPGGSVKDDDIIAKADELGLAMVFTGERHFLH